MLVMRVPPQLLGAYVGSPAEFVPVRLSNMTWLFGTALFEYAASLPPTILASSPSLSVEVVFSTSVGFSITHPSKW